MHNTVCMQNTEETIAKYVVDANLFRLGSTTAKKKYPAPECVLVGTRVTPIFDEFSRWLEK